MLDLANDMCGTGRLLLDAFAKCGFHCRLFASASSRMSPFALHQWLPLVDHFLRSSASAFSHFAEDRRLLEFLEAELRAARRDLDTEVAVGTLSVFASSPFFEAKDDPEVVDELVRTALSILSPNFLVRATNLAGNAIRILGSCLSKQPSGAHIEDIVRRSISVVIGTLFGPENAQISVGCASFLSLATYCSDAICFQLAESGSLERMATALIAGGPEFFRKCAEHCLRAVFNCLVACAEDAAWRRSAVEAFNIGDLGRVLRIALDEGSAPVEQLAIDVVSLFICVVNPDHVLRCARAFEMFERIPEVLDLGLAESVPNVLAAANRIIDVLARNPQSVDEVREVMAGAEVVGALDAFIESAEDGQVKEYAVAYHRWAQTFVDA
jgi:hypothetical protein